ncbi:hypothetical protein CASFOL_002311 [Castilleja foliolosa]|uniref:Clathrin light chain n=1 Tax=Castilleja foliolosa TaxID=1961234 RepID=A0ABD3EHM7_9LAMI
MQMSSNDNYNPFLVDPFELPAVSNEQSAVSAPTFQATPTFSAQNTDEIPFPVDDPFANGGEFTGEKMFSGSMDKQSLQREQHLWLHNQNKIIAKHLA